MRAKRVYILCLLLHFFTIPCIAQQEWKIWHRYPAREWEEALPVGNGRLGAMIYGGIDREQISLNEETIWSFEANPVIATSKTQYLMKRQRELIFEGKYKEADELKLHDVQIPRGTKVKEEKIDGMLSGRSIYKPLADLYLHFGSTESLPSDYRRELDLDRAVSTVTYKIDGVTYRREVFSSFPDQVIVVRITADRPGKISFSSKMTHRVDVKDDMYRYDAELGAKVASIRRPPDPVIRMLGDDHFSYNSTADPKGTSYSAHFKLVASGGKVAAIEKGFKVSNADTATIYITAATDYNHSDPDKVAEQQLLNAAKLPFEKLYRRHVEDHQALFRRVDISLEKSRISDLPTDKRVLAFQLDVKDNRVSESTPRDNNLYALYFQFGRYLLIASSRPGTNPPALQGIWNNSLLPPWFGMYTTDINIEMNYWPAEVANLSECHTALFDFVSPHIDKGKQVAKISYGNRGMAINSFSPWGPRTAYSSWIGFAGWLAQHYWEHFAYTQDKTFLKKKAYPFIKEAALFYLDYLVEYPGRGYLVTGPEYSPENRFIVPDDPDRSPRHLSVGTTMSRAIAYEVMSNAIKASKILGVDAKLRNEFGSAINRLWPYQVGKYNQLQEWLEDFDEAEPGHRHLSHLYPVYPGYEITEDKDPRLFEAARQSVLRRIDHNSGWTGWSRAWLLCLAARFDDADLALEQLNTLLATTTLSNLFDTHPRQGGNTLCFQVEGNFGATAGIAEMLMQSHEGYIDLLPAKPANWKNGYVNGLRARGGFELDISWKNSRLDEVVVHAKSTGPVELQYGEKRVSLKTVAGKSYTLAGDLVLK